MTNEDCAEFIDLPVGPCGAIYLKNFRCFGPRGQVLPLSRINVFVGPNSSGKSTVLRAVQLLQGSLDGRARLKLPYVTSCHKGMSNDAIVLGITAPPGCTDVHIEPWVIFTYRNGPAGNLALHRQEIRHGPDLGFQFEVTDDRFSLIDFRATPLALNGVLSKRREGPLTAVTESQLATIQRAVRAQRPEWYRGIWRFHQSALRKMLSEIGIPEDVAKAFEDAADEGYRSFGRNVYAIPPIRRIPTRAELIEISTTTDSFDEETQTDLWDRDPEKFAWRALLGGHEFVSGWLQRLTGYELVAKQQASRGADQPPGSYLVVRDVEGVLMDRVELDLTEVGTGISQVLPVIASCHVHHGLWVLLEQPELHLHPQAQCELADILVLSAKPQHNAYFIETHSEHLILRMLRRIRETTKGTVPDERLALTPEDISIFYFEPTGFGVIVHKMEVTADGDFAKRWPRGFFPERAEELFD
jgi:hypothetical protein